ncbi:MAG TPA: AAA family ATPase [Solirubrobacteraceae bacterium]|nr:AAA family ATPase [Solirubrobacteraceae bacterium]
MKIVVAGKGGVGKTTVSGTISRALARAGHDVLALDADTNPMLGVSLGVGPEETDLLVAVRQGLETGETEHERSTEGFVERFGRDAPDGVRLVVASRIERANPGCMCCGVSPEGLLTELDSADKIIIGDLEAGIGTVMRLQEGHADIVLVVAQPTAKSLNIARRAVELTDDRGGRVIVVANRVRNDDDLAVIREAVGDCEMVIVPDEPAIALADREGRAAIDVDPDAPGVRVLIELADRLAGMAVAA